MRRRAAISEAHQKPSEDHLGASDYEFGQNPDIEFARIEDLRRQQRLLQRRHGRRNDLDVELAPILRGQPRTKRMGGFGNGVIPHGYVR